MKELTIEQKAKAYDEAKARMSRAYNDNRCSIGFMNEIFPELKESEDDKVRKKLIHLVKKSHEQGGYALHKWDADEMLAWLEKAGEKTNPYSGISFEYNGHIWGMCARDNGVDILLDKQLFEHLERQSEQKPIIDGILTATNYDKMFQNCNVHKFKVGDWVVRGKTIAQILDIQEQYYVGIDIDGNDFTSSRYLSDDKIHLWTIQDDAKDGDVLFHSDSASNGIFIFKEIIDKGFAKEVICYCDYDSEDGFCLGEKHTCCWTNAKILHPATKEQHDLLFQKMKEAGYEWDVDKKELKKIDARENLTLDGDLMEADCMIVE